MSLDNEQVLSRQLTSAQLAMIAIGGAIGTGLFLGSALAVRVAGPGVILTYVIGAVVALLLMGALSEMAVAHPTAGSFGVYAEIYLSPYAGFVVRYTYWACQVIAIGGEATAVAIYCQWWWPQVPQWFWIAAFSVALIAVNASSVANFGEFEYWFAMIKVVAIVMFLIAGAIALFGWGPQPAIGLQHYTDHGGFLPHGWSGVWFAIVFVIFGYLGSEIVAVTSGEAKDPAEAVPRAMRTMVTRLIVFYLGAITILVGIVPWDQIHPGAAITASPFVLVFQRLGVPAAAHAINFVVLTAALSSMNCNLYLVTRMIFSLSRGGYAPSSWGTVTRR
jgi:amino acid transporter, AAT family